MSDDAFVQGEVLGNVDGEWREVAAIRGALRLRVEKVRGVLHSLRVQGLVESQRFVRECPTCHHAVGRVQWRLSDAGRKRLEEVRGA